jgi:hypothetical protein
VNRLRIFFIDFRDGFRFYWPLFFIAFVLPAAVVLFVLFAKHEGWHF